MNRETVTVIRAQNTQLAPRWVTPDEYKKMNPIRGASSAPLVSIAFVKLCYKVARSH